MLDVVIKSVESLWNGEGCFQMPYSVESFGPNLDWIDMLRLSHNTGKFVGEGNRLQLNVGRSIIPKYDTKVCSLRNRFMVLLI